MNSKQLHKHSLPIIVLSTGLCLVSVLLLTSIALRASPRGTDFVQLVTDRRLNIKPAANGLFHASRYHPGEQASSELPVNSGTSKPGLGAVNATGQTTTLNARLAR